MRESKKENKIKECKSKNLKNGHFNEEELCLYNFKNDDKDIIMQYQQLLPVLNESENVLVNARDLHDQLGVRKDFSNWIKDRISKYGFEEEVDYFTTHQKRRIGKTQGYKEISDYLLTISTAKELAMVQNNENGRIARKYFIAIENAHRNRVDWNFDRADTLLGCKSLQKAMIVYRKQLLENIPDWARSIQQAEFCLFNNVIIGMSASEYRKLHNLKKSDSIRNTFNEKQLEYVAELEKYDADLIMVQNIFDYDEREEILMKKYELMD